MYSVVQVNIMIKHKTYRSNQRQRQGWTQLSDV